VFLSSCSSHDKQERIIFPLYKKCVDFLPSYISDLNSRGYGIEAEYIQFDKQYEAHPGIVGTLILSPKPQYTSNFKIAVNGIELQCFPKHSSAVEADELGLRVLKMEMQAGRKANKEIEFLRLKDGKFIYYYPESAKIH